MVAAKAELWVGGGGCLKRQVAFERVRKTLVMNDPKLDWSHHGLRKIYIAGRVDQFLVLM